ncbi:MULTISPECIES: efflux RND transporter permease subunit [unclassified Thauera]|uniref:efflux RND transporter permease subunit n=1 Tax=unclassified Thauera TaxID=2609274 RepID=UPI0002CDF63D|nr:MULTISPECIES: efflux RND transporter permease subunit [unclassified Thauera]ENO93851.1 RND efflux transporter [Thauera sp. 28]WBL63744.1 efflux RND transporter permease subunit [Thauera sp. WB-2]HAG75137.1 transporter [Thauera sp.]HAY10346.1 transporter [Thauera sp.]HNR59845.1 efflux RND transporter permease subunit [Thauera sp.]
MLKAFVEFLGLLLFRRRRVFLGLFVVITLLLGASASRLQVDAGFEKMIPLEHEYMQTFMAYRNTFGGANRVLVALRQHEGDIYNEAFMSKLKAATDEVFFIPGVDRATVTSLFTPNVRFIEVVEAGFAGGNVIPADFEGTPEDLETVRENVLKSGRVGRLVSNDHRAAMISAELLEIDPNTGARLDYLAVAKQLEDLRTRHADDGLDVHIIGFAKAVGDITDGARGVLMFFVVAFLITAVLLYFYSGSAKLAALTLLCAMVPVVWLMGLLPLIGFGIDPMSILVPFLIFAIGVSHAVQMTHAWRLEIMEGAGPLTGAQNAFRRLFLPGSMALTTTVVGFLVIMRIEIDMVRELALTAGLGVALILLTNMLLLPLLLSWTRLDAAEMRRTMGAESKDHWLWTRLRTLAEPRRATVVLMVTALLLGIATWLSRDLRTGDLGHGIPELHEDARYNQDAAAIVESFSIGVDVLSVIVQSRGVDGACTNFDIMDTIDRFETTMRGVHGVQSVVGLPGVAKTVNAGWNEGNPAWRVLSRNPTVLAQSVTPVDTSTGLLNTDCSAMQVLIFTRDHEGATISHVIREVKAFRDANRGEHLDFLLASGNVGVMAATNEAVDAASVTILVLVFGVISVLFFLEFRSWRATLCIILPLMIAAVFCNALMALLGIGLKVSTLPVVAIAVGIGVDYGIYFYERMSDRFRKGDALPDAFYQALCQRGTAVMFTATTMSVGVGTWVFSALKFQADMGLLMAFMFIVNMLGALLLLPALAALLLKAGPAQEKKIS